MDRAEKINSLKVLLQQNGLQGMIIPTNDPHFSEYTQKHFSVREWLSGFDGSAGTLVITQEASALWTDSRYFVKATSDLKGSNIKLMKIKMPDTPSIPEWINSLYPNGASIAIDESLFSYSEYISLKKGLEPSCIKLISDPFDKIWKERPKIQFNNIRLVNSKYSGEESYSKLERITNKIYSSCNIQGNFAYIVSACDEVAWLCNIRGNDIEYNQIPQSYAIITHNAIHLFVDSTIVNDEIAEYLHKNKVELHNYNTFNNTLKDLKGQTVICSPNKITVKDFKTIQESGANIIYDPIPGGLVNYMKSIKNEYEIAGFRLAYKEDGIAMV
jgi:Creatinase/Prolidase N-terminal domain.